MGQSDEIGSITEKQCKVDDFDGKKIHVAGIVKKVVIVDEDCCRSPVLSLELKDILNNKLYCLHLGPDYIFRRNNILFKTGDLIRAELFGGEFMGREVFFVFNIRFDNKMVVLRYDTGEPSWRKGAGNVKILKTL